MNGLTGSDWPGAGSRSATRPQPASARIMKAENERNSMAASASRFAREFPAHGLMAIALCMRWLFPLSLLLSGCSAQQPAANEGEPVEEGVPKAGVNRSKAGTAAPDATFTDASGKTVSIADFKGKPVLLNLWASWCAPCVKELPMLDALGRKGALEVVAV